MNIDLPQELINECVELFNEGAGKMEVARLISEKTEFKMTASRKRANLIWDKYIGKEYINVYDRPKNDNKKDYIKQSGSSHLEFSDKYIFNKDNAKYIFLVESKIGKNIVLSEDKVKGIIKSYSNFKGEQSSINEIANKFDIPRKFVIEILRCLEITHDSIPVTNEDLSQKESDELVEEILQEKRFALSQQLQRRDWVETKRDAKSWRDFKSGILNPLQDYLDELSFDPLPKITPDSVKSFNDEDTIVVGITDIQIGASANGDVLYFGDEWNTEKAVEFMSYYSLKLIQKAKNSGINKAVLLFGGDIFHGLHGETAKGTLLKTDTQTFKQFDYSVEAVFGFIQRFAENFSSVDIHCGIGNHEGFASYPFFRLIESMFQNSSHLKFNISKKEFMNFRVKNSLFLFHHGASAEYKFKIPNDAKGRKELIHRILRIAEKKNQYKGIKRVFFIQGDIHHFQCIDYGQFTFYAFGSPVTGDEYADALALESTPCQNALVLGDGKDYSTLHITY